MLMFVYKKAMTFSVYNTKNPGACPGSIIQFFIVQN